MLQSPLSSMCDVLGRNTVAHSTVSPSHSTVPPLVLMAARYTRVLGVLGMPDGFVCTSAQPSGLLINAHIQL